MNKLKVFLLGLLFSFLTVFAVSEVLAQVTPTGTISASSSTCTLGVGGIDANHCGTTISWSAPDNTIPGLGVWVRDGTGGTNCSGNEIGITGATGSKSNPHITTGGQTFDLCYNGSSLNSVFVRGVATAVTTPPAGGTGGTANNNNNTNNNTQSQTVNVNNPAPAAAQPAVLGVKTLPKTGLPLSALLGLGLLPSGLLLRRFSRGTKVEQDPQFIWKDRQLNIDS